MRAKERYVRRWVQYSNVKKYVSSESSYVPSKVMWHRLQKFKAIYCAFTIHLFTVDGDFTLAARAGILELRFEQVSGSFQYTDRFFCRKLGAEK